LADLGPPFDLDQAVDLPLAVVERQVFAAGTAA
jgi:hypothetical protein